MLSVWWDYMSPKDRSVFKTAIYDFAEAYGKCPVNDLSDKVHYQAQCVGCNDKLDEIIRLVDVVVKEVANVTIDVTAERMMQESNDGRTDT